MTSARRPPRPPRGVALLGLAAALWTLSAPAAGAATRADRIWAALMAAPADRVFVQAHRGDHESAPENSLRSIDEAVERGVDIVEFDVRKTRDGALVVMHDPTVNRTTSGKGAVAGLTLAEVERLRLRGPGGALTAERVPTLARWLARARGRILLTLDIKVESPADVPEILAAVSRAGMDGRVLYYADDLADLDEVHRRAPAAVTLPLAGDAGQIDGLIARFGGVAVHLKPGYLNPALGEDLRRRGVRCIVNALHPQRTATDDLDAGYDALEAAGVTIIQTNRPTELIMDLAAHGRYRRIR